MVYGIPVMLVWTIIFAVTAAFVAFVIIVPIVLVAGSLILLDIREKATEMRKSQTVNEENCIC